MKRVPPAPGTPGADRRAVLAILVEAYGLDLIRRYRGDAIDFLRQAMSRNGWTQRDLAGLIGSRSRASELLNRRRRLTLDQIRRLHERWGLPLEVLIRPCQVEPESAPPLPGRAARDPLQGDR